MHQSVQESMNTFQLILHMCWGLGSICSRKWFEWLCEICQGNELGTTRGAIKCNHVLARQQGLLWHGMQKGSGAQLRSEDSRGSSERFNLSTRGEAVSADESVKRRFRSRLQHGLFCLLVWRTPTLTIPGTRREHLGRFLPEKGSQFFGEDQRWLQSHTQGT